MIKHAYWQNENEVAWEDESGLHSGVYAALSETAREALDEWVRQGHTITPYAAPVEDTLQSDLQNTFFEVMAENMKAGKTNITLREMVEEVGQRVKTKKELKQR
jgi:hypothetical protein